MKRASDVPLKLPLPRETLRQSGLERTVPQGKKAPSQRLIGSGLEIIPGSVLLSHRVSRAVPSALEGLTSEFEMGSGVAPPVIPPENCCPSASATLHACSVCHDGRILRSVLSLAINRLDLINGESRSKKK